MLIIQGDAAAPWLGTSLHTAAIEIYNKPDFKARDQIFPILLVNAWESLFKSFLVKRARNRLTVLYIPDSTSPSGFKMNRTGNYVTISLGDAIKKLMDSGVAIPPVLVQNVHRLIEVRDLATHLTAASESLPYVVYMLGAASLRNYARLAHEWYVLGLSRYDFYILPLGFSYPFHRIEPSELPKEPEVITRLLESIAWDQEHRAQEGGGYYFLVEIKTSLVSAKKIATEADWVARLAGEDEKDAARVVRRDVSLIDQYPYTFLEIWKRVKDEVPDASQADLLRLLRDNKVRKDPRYAHYNFRSKAEERRGPGPATAIVYNDNCLRWLLSEIGRLHEQ